MAAYQLATESVVGAAYGAVTDEQALQRRPQSSEVSQLAPAEPAV